MARGSFAAGTAMTLSAGLGLLVSGSGRLAPMSGVIRLIQTADLDAWQRVLVALCRPGDIVLVSHDCHKSHHYGLVLAGAQPYYIDAFPLTQYSMYGSLAIKPITDALKQLKAEGKLDRVRMLVLTNCTFDGHVANVERTMLECLAIKPDLIFLLSDNITGHGRYEVMQKEFTAAIKQVADTRVGDTVRLAVEPFDAHPDLQGERVIQDMEDPEGPMFYEPLR